MNRFNYLQAGCNIQFQFLLITDLTYLHETYYNNPPPRLMICYRKMTPPPLLPNQSNLKMTQQQYGRMTIPPLCR